MSAITLRRFPFVVALVALVGCSSPEPAQRATQPAPGYVTCASPRPEICTYEYRPVCASRDTGVRCVTTPCPSSEWVTRPNACTACSDPKVYGYRVAAC